MSFLLIAIIPIAIGIGVIALIIKLLTNNSNKKFTEKDGEAMLKNIYTYLVLFATLMMTIGGSVAVFIGLADYIVPSTYVEDYNNYRDNRIENEVFGGGQIAYTEEVYQKIMKEFKENGTEEQIRQDYEQMKQDKQDEAKANALRHILQSLGWIVIPLPIFIYFQRRRSQETA